MKVYPALSQVLEIAAGGEYRSLPLSCEILSDFTTPIETLRILKHVSSHCFLLESASQDQVWGRYTFLGFDPKMAVSCKDGVMKAGDLRFETSDPSSCLRQILSEYKSPRLPGLPPFTGGLAGCFSFEYLGYSEPAAICSGEGGEDFQDMDLMLFDRIIAFDHMRQKIILMVHMSLTSRRPLTTGPFWSWNA